MAKALANGRCKLHGGMSTGPKTAEGKARALANLKQNRKEIIKNQTHTYTGLKYCRSIGDLLIVVRNRRDVYRRANLIY